MKEIFFFLPQVLQTTQSGRPERAQHDGHGCASQYYVRKKHYMLLVVNKIMVNHEDGAFVQTMHSFGLMHLLSVHSCERNRAVFIHEMRC